MQSTEVWQEQEVKGVECSVFSRNVWTENLKNGYFGSKIIKNHHNVTSDVISMNCKPSSISQNGPEEEGSISNICSLSRDRRINMLLCNASKLIYPKIAPILVTLYFISGALTLSSSWVCSLICWLGNPKSEPRAKELLCA